jgi:hypothetical protein
MIDMLRHILFQCCLGIAVCLPAQAAQAQPPATILIKGQLLNAQGDPVPGLRQYRVRFFDGEVDGTQLGGNLMDFTSIGPEGLFSFAIEPSQEVLSAGPLWYELAIDSTPIPNGVDASDVFPSRIRVHSVPYARVAEMAMRVPAEGVGDGGVAGAEFGALSGVAGNIQAQLDAKANVTDLALYATSSDLADRAPRKGPAFVSAEVTNDPVQNGANLVTAYAEASALTPNGLSLGPSNRAVVIVPPGQYDLGLSSLNLTVPYVDLVGSTTTRDSQRIQGHGEIGATGVLRQFVDDVRIENLTIECTRSNGGVNTDANDPAAYAPMAGYPGTVVRNCHFVADETNAFSMRIGVPYAGTFERCVAGKYAFGGLSDASGRFVECTGGESAFGYDGVASGIFIDCVGADFSFGSFGNATGTFTRCAAGASSFGGSGIASGVFTDCQGGSFALGGGGTASGTFVRCVAETNGLGGSPFGSTLGALLIGCRLDGTWTSGTFRGRMEGCRWGSGITLGAEARVYGSTFLGTVNLNNTAAGLTQSRAQSITNAASNTFGATNAAALNVASAGVQ